MANESTSKGLGAFLIRHRYAVLIAVVLLTAVFAMFIPRVRLKTPTIDLFPKNHPYVQTYVKYEDIFGGANVIAMSLEVNEGDVYNRDTLEKLKRITKALELLPAVNNYSVLSLAQRKTKITTVDEIAGFKSDPVMWPDVPETPEEIEELRRKIYASGRYHGSLVSADDKALMILAGFFEKGLQSASDDLGTVARSLAASEGRDPDEAVRVLEELAKTQVWTTEDTLFDAIDKICAAEEDANHHVRMIGRPILLGWIARQFPQLVWIFCLTIASIVICLILYFPQHGRRSHPGGHRRGVRGLGRRVSRTSRLSRDGQRHRFFRSRRLSL
ncbi:MAG: hypothetical protein M5R36_20420 [Deltaproteobacteria bacterium]|nr:hypothetical protein [Deltaproteobacteria bacterium]